jgi:hypothetical protein
MVDRIRLNPKKISNSSGVGYRKPPRSSQFKTGQSGNPAGRPKGIPNFKTELLATLQIPVKVNKNGRSRKISTRRASLMVLREKALAGDQRAIEHLIGLALRFDEEIADTGIHRVDSNDQAILDDYFKERSDEANRARLSDQDHPSGPKPGSTDQEELSR